MQLRIDDTLKQHSQGRKHGYWAIEIWISDRTFTLINGSNTRYLPRVQIYIHDETKYKLDD